jgi:SAM-dependent methyltransferase
VANEAETRRWNDDRWAAAWPRRERLTEAVSLPLLHAVAAWPGQRVCDIGCGGGALTIALARAVGPAGRAVGMDVSAPLLELARGRAKESGVDNVDFVQRDVQTAAPGGERFDIAVSQFGVMFFDEPLAAFGAVRASLVRGGRLVFACWQGVEHNPWHVGTALRPLLASRPTPPPGKSPVGPFVFGDDEYVRDLLGGAGFAAVGSTPHAATVRAPADAVVDRSLLPFMGIPPAREHEAMALVDRHLRRFEVGPGEYEYPLAFTVFHAVNP